MTIKGKNAIADHSDASKTYAGNAYLIRRVKDELNNYPDSKIWDLISKNPDNLTPKIIDMAAVKGDEFAMSVIIDLGIFWVQLSVLFAIF